jgi:hypothetical protein
MGRAGLGLVAAGAVAAGGLGISGVAQAKSVRCDLSGRCKTYCTQSLPNGNYIEYEEGTKIIVTNADGKETTYTCKNGEWVQTRLFANGSVLAQASGTKLSIATR